VVGVVCLFEGCDCVFVFEGDFDVVEVVKQLVFCFFVDFEFDYVVCEGYGLVVDVDMVVVCCCEVVVCVFG